jgi:hypothetical protein
MTDIQSHHPEDVRPLELVIAFYFWLHKKISVRAHLFGVDPTQTPHFITKHESAWFNRDFLVDIYAIIWPIGSVIALWWVGTSTVSENKIYCLLIVGLVAAYRLNELFGGVFYILINRARHDYADGRKLLISLFAYLEPILLFAVLHGVLSDVLGIVQALSTPGTGYTFAGRSWGAISILHFSVGCYTTVGWGDISASYPSTMILSDIEAVAGIIMLTLTVSRFVSAALDSGMSQESRKEPPSIES